MQMYSRRPIDLNPAADASAIVAAICASGRARDFFVYKTNSETRIACDCRVKILVTSGRLGITSGGSEPSWSPVVDPLKEIEGLLHNLPDSPWTAYGYVAFDSCKFYHPYDRASHWPLIQFFIPKYEIRIGLQDATVVCPDDDGAVVSVINQAVLKQDFTPEPLQSDSSDYEAFCESVNEAIRLISKGALQKVILSRFIRRQRTIDLL